MITGAPSVIGQTGANLREAFRHLTRSPRHGGPKPVWPPLSRLAIGTAATIVLIAFAMLVLDPRSFANVRRLPETVLTFFGLLTDFGLAGVVLIPTGIALIVLMLAVGPWLGHRRREALAVLTLRLGFVFAAVAVPGAAITIVKRVIGRARPFVEGNDPYNYLWRWQVDYESFPSGHATGAFSIAVALGAVWPRARPYLWLYAGVVALSRVGLSFHYPSDVMAGAVCGALGALLVRHYFAVRRLGFSVEVDGGIAMKRGFTLPRLRRWLRRDQPRPR